MRPLDPRSNSALRPPYVLPCEGFAYPSVGVGPACVRLSRTAQGNGFGSPSGPRGMAPNGPRGGSELPGAGLCTGRFGPDCRHREGNRRAALVSWSPPGPYAPPDNPKPANAPPPTPLIDCQLRDRGRPVRAVPRRAGWPSCRSLQPLTLPRSAPDQPVAMITELPHPLLRLIIGATDRRGSPRASRPRDHRARRRGCGTRSRPETDPPRPLTRTTPGAKGPACGSPLTEAAGEPVRERRTSVSGGEPRAGRRLSDRPQVDELRPLPQPRDDASTHLVGLFLGLASEHVCAGAARPPPGRSAARSRG